MRYPRMTLLLVMLTSVLANSQQLHRSHPEATSEATIQRSGSLVQITSVDPRPLGQVLESLSQEYGWTVNYEDPFYGDGDLADDTDPQWRISHPQSQGTRIPGGGYFRTHFTEASNMQRGSDGENSALKQIVSDYNQSGNPGTFELRIGENGSLNVIGIAARNTTGTVAKSPPVLDTAVSIPVASRSANATIELILQQVSLRSGIRVAWGMMPLNVIAMHTVSVGGVNVAARDLLQQTIDAMPRRMAWRLLLDPDTQTYHFNLRSATQVIKDASGKRVVEFLPLKSDLSENPR